MCKRTNQEQIEIIARNLRVLMSSHNLSQVDMSEIAMVSESAVSNWLTGRNAPSMGSVERIATHLGIRKSDIVDINIPANNLSHSYNCSEPQTIKPKFKEIMAKNIQKNLDRIGINSRQLSEQLNIPYTTVRSWITQDSYPRIDKIEQMANFFKISKSALVEDSYDLPPNLYRLKRVNRIPILGTIACGTPILAEENYQGYFTVDDLIKADFCLFAKGDSMIDANIFDGDIVFIRQTPVVENGTIAAVVIGDEATLKRVYLDDNHLVLQPANKNYSPLVYSEDDAKDKNIMVIGEMVGIYHEVNKNK